MIVRPSSARGVVRRTAASGTGAVTSTISMA